MTVKIYDMETTFGRFVTFSYLFGQQAYEFGHQVVEKGKKTYQNIQNCLHVVNFDCRIRNHPIKYDNLFVFKKISNFKIP